MMYDPRLMDKVMKEVKGEKEIKVTFLKISFGRIKNFFKGLVKK